TCHTSARRCITQNQIEVCAGTTPRSASSGRSSADKRHCCRRRMRRPRQSTPSLGSRGAMRALIFGPSGQVGPALHDCAPARAVVVAHDLEETDIRDADAIARSIHAERPDVILNCAAFTKVDDAETSQDDAFAANAAAPGVMAEVSVSVG